VTGSGGQDGIRAMQMRGGTSKGLYFLADDLPAAADSRDDLLLRVMGSPDPRQIDGTGGAHPLTSKVAVVSPSAVPGIDVDYLFLQVMVDKPIVTDKQNCGNILAGVGPFAVERGLFPAGADETSVRIRMVNSESVAVALPPVRTWDAPARIDGPQVMVHGLATRALRRHDTIVVVASDQRGHASFVVPTAALKLEHIRGLDPDLGLVEVTGSLEQGSLAGGTVADWSAAVAAGQLAVGHELVGAARAMLELARVHALERLQFGRPIASFQAVRHRLAESLVAIEAATALLAAAWDEPDPEFAAMAKAVAGRSARTVARHGQQVLAGIGFTTEHPFHRYFRRVVVLDQLFGASSELTRELGEGVLKRGSLPATFPL